MRVFALSSSLFSLFVGLLAPSDRSCCAVQLVFLAFRLSFPPSRRAALRMPRPTMRSASRSSRSSQPPRPTSNNDKPPSSTEPSPSPSSSQPLRLSGSPRRSAASKAQGRISHRFPGFRKPLQKKKKNNPARQDTVESVFFVQNFV